MSTIIVNPQSTYQAPGWQQGVADLTPDPLSSSALSDLVGAAGPGLSPGLDLSSSAITQETAGGLPLATQAAALLGTTGSTATTLLWIGGGVLGLFVLLSVMKGGRRRR